MALEVWAVAGLLKVSCTSFWSELTYLAKFNVVSNEACVSVGFCITLNEHSFAWNVEVIVLNCSCFLKVGIASLFVNLA